MSPGMPVSERSLWLETAGPAPDFDGLDGDTACDVAVIGAGFTGLTAALLLAEAGLSVLLLEAREPGWGASGRNAGFVVPTLSRADPDAMRRILGAERGERLARAVGAGGPGVFALARRHAIACDQVENGWVQPVHAAALVDGVRRRCDQWAALGQLVDWLDRAAVAEITGTDRFVAGWIHSGGGAIHPVKYLYGLAAAFARAGGRLVCRTPVRRWRRGGDGWMLEIDSGTVATDRLLVCTNALAGPLDRALARCFVPLTVYQMATQPLGDEAAARLTPGRQPVSDTRADVFTYRLDSENRLITGGMAAIPLAAGPRIAGRMQRRLASELRLAAPPPVEILWRGTAAVTRDFLPAIHRLGPGAWAGFACNARGIASTHVLAHDLVRLVRDGEAAAEETAVPVRPLRPLPLAGLAAALPHLWLIKGRLDDRRLQT